MNHIKLVFIKLFFFFSLTLLILHAEVPKEINYQGTLVQNGEPVNGNVTIIFKLFDDEAEGAELWSEAHPSVTISEGIYHVQLGSITPFPPDLFTTSGNRFIDILVNGTQLSPRTKFTSVAYSLSTEYAVKSKMADHAVLSDGVISNSITKDEIVDEPGLTFEAPGVSIDLVSTEHTDLVTVTISVPKAGYIFLTGRGMVELRGTTLLNGIRMQIDTTAAGPDQNNIYSYVLFSEFTSDGLHYFDCSAQRTYIVERPGEYTFRLEARKFGDNGTAKIVWPVLTAQYFPTAYGVVTSSSAIINLGTDNVHPQN